MFTSEDGYNHQANMTYVVTQSDMTLKDSWYDVMNIRRGYVSHSFNQFIQTDGESIFRVDHGDACPRAVAVTRCAVGGSITNVSYTNALTIPGEIGDNATGVSVGGFELWEDRLLIAGNSVDLSDESTYSAYGVRNIFLASVSKDLSDTKLTWLTSYGEDSDITVRTPQLVKLGGGRFLVLWEEVGGSWYYFDASGAMQTGWLLRGNVWYWFYPDGSMAAGETVAGFTFDAYGAWIG